MKMRNFVAGLALVSLMFAVGTAEARIGSSSYTGHSYSSSYSHHSYSSSGRIGGGGSMGMQRSGVMAQARSNVTRSYGNVGSQPVYRPSYGPSPVSRPQYHQAYQPQYHSGYSGAHVAGAAIAGAAVGYALSNHGNQAPAIVNNNGGQPGSGNGGYAPQGGGYAPAYGGGVAPVVVHHSGIGFGGVLLIILVLVAVFFIIRKLMENNNEPVYATSAGSYNAPVYGQDSEEAQDLAQARQLLHQAPAFFRQLQDANNRGDKMALEQMVDSSLYASLAQDIDTRSAPSQTAVHSVHVVGDQVMGFEREATRYVGSIQFQANVQEGNGPVETINEVWHFVKGLNGAPWQLAGIEQV